MPMRYLINAACLVLLSLLFSHGRLLYAAEKNLIDKSSIYIDLDGDGIDDNAPDSNGDGIPDFSAPSKESSRTPVKSALGDIFNSPEMTKTDKLAELRSCCERFSEVKFKVRAMALHRIGLNGTDPFGSGIGIGSAASGACAGGVCH